MNHELIYGAVKIVSNWQIYKIM